MRITRLDKSVPIPKYETSGAVGFDLASNENIEIKPEEIKLISTGLIIAVPKGYMLMIASRSSTPRKKGLMKPHGIGVIDQDYCGPNDEIKIQVYNFTKVTVKIEKGDRLAQGIFVRVDRFDFKEVQKIKKNNRGGFGSTG
ncbi:dUTPase [Candidatus Peregrinibacteria bacterium RIFOXYB2_FULL_33_20]|nr:MAG: dUTPase [Candidatus Peregrinibacteria bacterium RIFOXYA2_FULL_33_21]OGJ50368.1 MAG: dUTPase [Candidatus Peregrinibacteria bacterium RIFOXYB2_FULL_33_20]